MCVKVMVENINCFVFSTGSHSTSAHENLVCFSLMHYAQTGACCIVYSSGLHLVSPLPMFKWLIHLRRAFKVAACHITCICLCRKRLYVEFCWPGLQTFLSLLLFLPASCNLSLKSDLCFSVAKLFALIKKRGCFLWEITDYKYNIISYK